MQKFLPFLLVLALFVGLAPAPERPIQSTIDKTVQVDWVVDKETQGHCTGIQIGIRWVLTMAHCLPEEGIKADVLVDNEVARVIKQDPEIDLALLGTETNAQRGIMEFREGSPDQGEALLAVGFAWDEPIYVLKRFVARVDDDYVYTDGSFIPGMSGGPVVDLNGKLVGIIQKGWPGGVGGAINVKVIKKFLK